MASLIFAAIVLLTIFVLLALYARGGPTETINLLGVPPEAAGVTHLTLSELGSVTRRLFNELGFTTVSEMAFPDRYDMVVETGGNFVSVQVKSSSRLDSWFTAR